MPRIVSIWLPRWPIQRFLTARTRFGSPDGDPASIDGHKPFILTIEASGGPRIAALNRAAEAEGLAIGGLVADARARAPGLQTRSFAPETDRQALHRLGLWAMRYSPCVALYRDSDSADGLFIDIAGASHLVGGEDALLKDIAMRLRHFSLHSRLAVADTPGAAWALSRFARKAHPILPHRGEAGAALAPLPFAALRLPDDLCQTLRRLGFSRIGDLLGKDRAPFAARFEATLLNRLDQALGRSPEALELLQPPPSYHCSRQLLEPIGSQDAVVRVASRLMEDLAPALARDGLGARNLILRLFRVDGDISAIPIGLATATRDPAHIARLVALDLERKGETMDAGFGFETLSLTATLTERIDNRQNSLALLTGDRAATASGVDDRAVSLLDALRQRLGASRVQQMHALALHDPARAETLRPAAGTFPIWPARDPSRLRPPLFLDRPETIQVLTFGPDGLPGHFRWRGAGHVIADLQGPERIAGQWWRQTVPPSHLPTQDYYLAQTRASQRFWLCHEQTATKTQWSVRGIFA